jgi:hypothetical protein
MLGMRHRVLLAGLVASVLVIMSLSTFAQESDPRMGTWKINLVKSKYNPGPPPKSQTLKFEPASGGFTLTTDGVSAQGSPTHSEITAKFDGKAYVVTGNPVGPISRVYKRVDAHTIESQDTVKAVPSFRRTEVVSADGKTLTVTVKGPDAQGRMTNNVVVYDKQ